VEAGAARAALGMDAGHEPWLAELAALGPPPGGIPLPHPQRAAALLPLLDVGAEDAANVLRSRPEREAAPWLWWLLERAYHQLIAGMDGVAGPPPWRRLPDGLGPAGAHLYSWLFLSALPAARDNHARRGVDDDVSWATLGDVGRQARLCRQLYGRDGIAAPDWLALHFRGTLFQLGRLQFQRARWTVAQARRVVPEAAAELPVLDVHIPANGPLAPRLCDRSFGYARRFFPRHFPEERYRFAVCTSWLLDDQLAEYLPETSNTVAFQRRFHLVPLGEDTGTEGDASVVEFVFRRPRGLPLRDNDIAALPQDTTLQRAIVMHLRQGRHWRWRTGWCRL
jgi:GNAT-like C-terminal domain/N-acyltransferase N-terminal domain